MIFCDELDELINIDQSVFDIHGPCVVNSAGDQPLVKPKVVNGAVSKGQVYHLLRWKIS